MKPKVHLFAALLTALLLTACTRPVDGDDYVFTRSPVIEVSSVEAEVGSFVTVDVSTDLFLPSGSRVDKRSGNIELGVCFQEVSEDPIQCPHYSFQKPGTVALGDNDSLSKRESVVVQRGHQIAVTHSLAFTTTQSGTVRIVGVIFSDSNDLSPSVSGISNVGDTKVVQFR